MIRYWKTRLFHAFTMTAIVGLTASICVALPLSNSDVDLKPPTRAPSRPVAAPSSSFENMHDRFVEQFVKSEGLGLSRTAAPSRPVAAPSSSFENMHDRYVDQFKKSKGFGPSRMVQPPMQERQLSRMVSIGNETYSIKSFELIGIAKHDPPVVHRNYVHSRWRTTNAWTSKETRELTEFEQGALAMFRKGGELGQRVEDRDRIVVGSIRATEQCIKCHEGAMAGDLLGAFTYRLTPAEPQRTALPLPSINVLIDR